MFTVLILSRDAAAFLNWTFFVFQAPWVTLFDLMRQLFLQQQQKYLFTKKQLSRNAFRLVIDGGPLINLVK